MHLFSPHRTMKERSWLDLPERHHPCVHRGRERHIRPGMLRRFKCDYRGTCRISECADCEDRREPYTIELSTRNLIYHVGPFQGSSAWRHNIERLRRSQELFNGARMIAIVTGPHMAKVEDVKEAFRGWDVEFLVVENDPILRENATFLQLMDKVADPDPATATFYAHTKGVSTIGNNRGVAMWRNAMYRRLLDWETVAEALWAYPIVGTHRRWTGDVDHFPDKRTKSEWHYAGTFFWFRNADVFATDRWRDVHQLTGWGVEAWPGRMFPYRASGCIAYDKTCNPYAPETYADEPPLTGDEGQSVSHNYQVGQWYAIPDNSTVIAPTPPWPIDDNSSGFIRIAACLTCHDGPQIVREVLRISQLYALVEVLVSHPCALETGRFACHAHRWSIEDIEAIACEAAIPYGSQHKRLEHVATTYHPGCEFENGKRDHPGWDDARILRYVPGTCRAIHYQFHVTVE